MKKDSVGIPLNARKITYLGATWVNLDDIIISFAGVEPGLSARVEDIAKAFKGLR